MANIIGRGFENYVTEQINTRQKKLNKSSDNYQEGVLQYTTNKTSWIRLSSGVNVDASKTQELGLSGQESSILAQNNIISTGIVNSNLSLNYTANVNYGYTPPVGIKSVDVKSLNKGSLREANIQITCHNLYQFNIIETLYLRLGYSILLEWGHTMWFDNKTQEINNVVDNSVLNSFLYSKPPATKESLLNLINETKY